MQGWRRGETIGTSRKASDSQAQLEGSCDMSMGELDIFVCQCVNTCVTIKVCM